MTDSRFNAIVKAGTKPVLLIRLASVAASGSSGLDPVQEFQIEDWCLDFEEKRNKLGITEWMP